MGPAPDKYALLVPEATAVAEINAISDTPITVKHLPSILARFRHLDPPYPSFPVARSASAARKAYVAVFGVVLPVAMRPRLFPTPISVAFEGHMPHPRGIAFLWPFLWPQRAAIPLSD